MNTDVSAAINLRTLTAPQEFQVGDFKLRKVTGGTLELCRQVGVGALVDGGVKLTTGEIQKMLVVFLYIHALPIEEVLEACAKPAELFQKEHILPFSFQVPFQTLMQVSDFYEKQMSCIDAAQVDIKVKPPIPGAGPIAEPPNS